MNILVVNAGSSSLKLSVIGKDEATLAETEFEGAPEGATHDGALLHFIDAQRDLGAAGHRIVHGGAVLRAPVIVDDAVRAQLETTARLAPLHVPPALAVLDKVRGYTSLTQVACFDTAFHASLPAAATTYAIPLLWREDFGIRRYGFHGLSCAWSLRRAASLLGRPPASLQLVVAHLGAGASVTAIRDGHSVDTSMGFTPLEGLVMATRSGSVDPGALLYMQTHGGIGPAAMNDTLERASGTLGLAGSADMREILARGDANAALARDVYVHRARALLSGVAASLDRLDAIVFTGGVGENAGEIRSRICAGLGVLGVVTPAGTTVPHCDAVISAPTADVAILVVRAREDLEISREVRELIDR
ncbi:MAG TPA: acetate/propionate family kinase [Candidatus Saccharimonadales bacterium]|nr:acetate/propionate family kinase [Candidatus Saccharimonadales bacterium]